MQGSFKQEATQLSKAVELCAWQENDGGSRGEIRSYCVWRSVPEIDHGQCHIRPAVAIPRIRVDDLQEKSKIQCQVTSKQSLEGGFSHV